MMITINGTTFNGNSITISGNRVIIDGQDVTPDSKEINIVVEGNVNEIKADYVNTFSMKGTCGEVSTQSGDVNIEGDVTGNVSTMSGDVDCYNVGGNISTMSGDIKHRTK